MTSVGKAFRQARVKALQHMETCDRAKLRWAETSITEIVISEAASAVSVAPFSQREEGTVGADWVWWWVDASSSYGMLVQAKRLTVKPQGRWKFDFSFKGKTATSSQHELLRSAAAQLDLLPAYALYLGTPEYRGNEMCSPDHQSSDCQACAMRSISMMPAILANEHLVNDAPTTYSSSVALEEMWKPNNTPSLILPTIERHLTADLANFVAEEQRGSRAVARAMFDLVARARFGQFAAATPGLAPYRAGLDDRLGSVFQNFPEDTMHGGIKYFPHALQSLHHAPPAYVLEVESGDVDLASVADQMPPSVAGVVVIRTPDSAERPAP